MCDFLPHLYGQEKLKKELKRLLKDERIPHTLIFYGDEGLGKTTAALDLAGIITDRIDSLWNAFSSIAKEDLSKAPVITLADQLVWYLHPVGLELKIEQFRIFLEAMASFDEKTHVCIIDEAQTMMAPVANSLLKTLEEPEGNIHFILITHDLDSLLPTIISRGERFGFFPLNKKDFFSLVKSSPERFKPPEGMDESLLYQISEGNPGIALEVCEEKGNKGPEWAMHFWEVLTGSTLPFSILSAEEFKDRYEFLKALRWISLVGRDIMVLSQTGNASLVRCAPIFEKEWKISTYWSGGRGEEAMKVLKIAETAVARYINTKNVWDFIIIELTHIQKGEKKWIR